MLTLALGIGETTAMFTVIRSVLLKPLPYQHADRLVQLSRGATSTRFREMKGAAKSYAELGAYLYNTFDVTLSGGAQPEVLKGVSISGNFLEILEVQPLRGRGFRPEEDTAGGSRVAMISEAFWHGRFAGDPGIPWPAYPSGLSPLGQRILIGDQPKPVEVVGIVADMNQVLERDPWPAIFRPFDQYPLSSASLLVRTSGDPRQIINAVRGRVQAMDRDQPVSAVQTMEDLIELEGGQRRAIVILLGCFAGGSLLLALIGMYGVIAYSVTQRTQEVGIRRAMGARSTDILRLVVGEGVALTLAGIALGIGGAVALTRFMSALLFHTNPIDPAAYTGVALLFVLVALAASCIPARYAARIDPMTAIRN